MITIYSMSRKFPWFPDYKVEIKYQSFSLKKVFHDNYLFQVKKFPWFPGYKVEVVVLYSFAYVCLYIYTLYLVNLVSLYCVIVLVILSSIYYCLLIIFHDIRRYYRSQT